MDSSLIRNFVITAHIDHGKSTLSDRLLETTGTVAHRDMSEELLGVQQDEVLLGSAKEGLGIAELLEAVVQRIPPPPGDVSQPLSAMIFDSHYDAYKGVVAYVRIMQGSVRTSQPLIQMAHNQK